MWFELLDNFLKTVVSICPAHSSIVMRLALFLLGRLNRKVHIEAIADSAAEDSELPFNFL